MAMVFAAGEPGSLPPLVAAQVHGLFAAAARHRGDLADDLAGYRRVLSAFEAAGDLRSACNTRVSVAFAHIELGQWDVAERELTAALDDAERLGLAPVATRARQNLALVWAHHGRLADAASLLDRVILEAREQENSRFEGWTRVYRARIALLSNDLSAARAQIRGALTLLATSPPALAGARAVWSQVLVAAGRHAEAVTEASLAVATVDDLGGIEEFESLARLALIEAHLASGDHASARLAISRAADRLHERAAAIGDAALRTTFLDQVPENRRVLELARDV
jgi:eukaryotic-like serine/threonine-protein kinase